MLFENVVCKWDDHDDGRGWGVEGKAGKSFDERSEKSGG